jgi:hypothetical protein
LFKFYSGSLYDQLSSSRIDFDHIYVHVNTCRETAQQLDQTVLEQLGIELKQREFDEDILSHTRSAYTVCCPSLDGNRCHIRLSLSLVYNFE